MKHTKAINAICAFGLVLATVVTFNYMNPHSIYHRWGACLIATVVGGIAVIACWGMFTACEDPETRRRLAPFCIPLTVQTLLLPLCDICSLLWIDLMATLILVFYLLCIPLFLLFVLVYPFCIRMNRVLRATADVFAADLLVQAVLFVLLLYYRRAG
ncbi:MAG: hypothetical protein IKS34_00595 [Clostridia bacterium]|nr:hypothetical protein [Clostridia bacterium]